MASSATPTAGSRHSLMRYVVVIEKGPASYGAYVPDLPGCVAVGETEHEARELIAEAIEFHLEGLRDAGQPIPPPASRVEYVEVGVPGIAKPGRA